ncbi:MAG TPA: ATP-binding cassette domain-containing protein [Acholeplasmataceae bacterium]|jgi:iron complex transport system ATP-binding protein|nr:ATP-binding cassette domain-containing protein [Acholeplasmataceae bacterium]
MIRVESLSKKYQDHEVVKSVNLIIEKGKLTTIIGPNGAGKSTLLGMVSRLLEKTAGVVYVNEIPIEEWNENELAKTLAILKQDNNVGMRITIEELVGFGRFPYSQGKLTKEDQEHIDNAINYMGLNDIRNKYLNELSGGQRQRAFIAMIIAQNTEYILLDEPLNSLDIKHAKELMKIIRELVDNLGKTVVMVLHDINFASCYSDRIIAMQDGNVVQIGNVEEIICGDLLEELYETPIRIENYEERKICIYY